MSSGREVSECCIVKDVEVSVVAKFKVLCQNLLGGTEEDNEMC